MTVETSAPQLEKKEIFDCLNLHAFPLLFVPHYASYRLSHFFPEGKVGEVRVEEVGEVRVGEAGWARKGN